MGLLLRTSMVDSELPKEALTNHKSTHFFGFLNIVDKISGNCAVAPTSSAKGAAGACAFYALVFTLLTPLLSANSLAVPSSVVTRGDFNVHPTNNPTFTKYDHNESLKTQTFSRNVVFKSRSLKWIDSESKYLSKRQENPLAPYLSWYKIVQHQSPNDGSISKLTENGEGFDDSFIQVQNRTNGYSRGSIRNQSVNSYQNLINSNISGPRNQETKTTINNSVDESLWKGAYSLIGKSVKFESLKESKNKIVLNRLNRSGNLKIKRSEVSALNVSLSLSRTSRNQRRFYSKSVSDVSAFNTNQWNQTTSTENSTNLPIVTTTYTSTSPKSVIEQNSAQNSSFFHQYGYIVLAAAISLTGAVTITLVIVLRCLRATRRATGALALPIPLLPEDRTPLNAEPEHPVPMLSVQSAGCAGMERLGVPARTSLSSPPDDRGHISRRMRVDAIQARDILVRDATMLSDRQVRSSHYHRGGCGNNRGIDSCVGGHAEVIRCPHHVPLPDSEWGQDRDLQIRTRYQQAEITRSYIKPPPNKTVLDVPEQSYNLFSSSSFSSSLASAATSCNLGPNYSSQHSNQQHHHHQQQQQHHHPQQQQQQKSKPNVITKFFSRKSSPKSPSSVSSSSTTATSTSSSSSSSLCSSPALPISTASALTTTNCNLGMSIGPSLSTLSGISITTASTGCTTSPVGVTIPTNNITTTSGANSNNHFHQNTLVGSTNHSLSSSSTALQVAGNSCNISTTSLASSSSSSSSMGSLSSPSTDCCYTQATSVRPRTPIAVNISNRTIPTDGASNNNQQLLQRDHV